MLESAPLLRPPPILKLQSPLPTSPSPAPSKLYTAGVPITRAARAHFHTLASMAGVLDFLEEECGVEPWGGGGGDGVVDPWRKRSVEDQFVSPELAEARKLVAIESAVN